MSRFSEYELRAMEASATAAAHYLDVCDFGAHGVRLDPAYYRACGDLLVKLFLLVDAGECFPDLLSGSPAAREVAEAVGIGRRIEVSVNGYYPELSLLLNRVTA